MIVTKKMAGIKAGKTRKLMCPICKRGRLCDISRKHQSIMCGNLEVNDEIYIKCPICNSHIGIALE